MIAKAAAFLLPDPFRLAVRCRLEAQALRARQRAVADQLVRAAADVSARCLDEVQSREDWLARRPALRRQLLFMLGLDPLPERMPLAPETVGVLERPGYRVEKQVFQCLPGMQMTGNFKAIDARDF